MRLTPATSASQMQYYLNVESGDKDFPFTKVYTTQMNKYALTTTFYKTETIYNEDGSSYLETKQVCAILKYPNLEYKAPTIDLTRNLKLVILPCNQLAEPKSFGEPGFWKYWYPEYVKVSYIY